MRRLVLTVTVGLTAVCLAAPTLADTTVSTGTTTVSTPPSAPVGATVTLDELLVVTVPDDLASGGMVSVSTGPATVEPRGVPDPLAPAPTDEDEKRKKAKKERDEDARGR